MSTDPLDALAEKLNGGDAEAIAQAFRTHEHYLRMIVRRQLSGQLRAKFDSVDIVHSVWARLLPGFCAGRWHFNDANELRAFLVKVTRNHLVNRIQRVSLELDYRRTPLPIQSRSVSNDPQPEENLAAEELWQELLGLCPPAHRPLLLLKREGLSLDQIAVRIGMHKSSIRRILYDLMRRYQARRRTRAKSVEVS